MDDLNQLTLTPDESTVLKVLYTMGASATGLNGEPDPEFLVRTRLAGEHIQESPSLFVAFNTLADKMSLLLHVIKTTESIKELTG